MSENSISAVENEARAANMCDEPGCTREVTCGWASPTGYRWTCHECWLKANERPPK